MTTRDVELGLLAALLHDIAQYPMAHDLSEAAGELEHERYTRQVLERLYEGCEESLAQVLDTQWNVQAEELMGILEPATSLKKRILHSIISGPLDCDKLDYLRRDSTHLGVTFGLAVDGGRLLRNLTVVYSSKFKGTDSVLDVAEITVTEKALVIANGLIHVRSEMFTQVYWHHTVRALKAMLSYVVRQVLISVEDYARARAAMAVSVE